MLDEVIKGVKQRSSAGFCKKKADWYEKIVMLTSEKSSRFVEAFSSIPEEQQTA